ncbi:MAG: GTP 3',8-cyclase MoaA [bacterium]
MLIDQLNRPLKDLRISVTDKCNFRCTYCMPEEVFGFKYEFLPRYKILTFEEITRLVTLFVQLGVTKVRLTGGEPLLRHQLEKLIGQLAQVAGLHDIALTTNGYFLAQKAQMLKEAGLHRLTISLDTLAPEAFKRLAGGHLQLERVLEGIRAATDMGFSPIKINTVIQRGVNEHEILPLVRFARTHGHIIRFIEYMDVGNLNGWKMDEVVTADEIVEIVSREVPLIPVPKTQQNEVANRFKFDDGSGELGVIASVSQPFCTTCTRARLSADGKIYTCLFGSDGLDVKTRMRQGAEDAELLERIVSLWRGRFDRYSEERSSATEGQNERRVEMYQIGG